MTCTHENLQILDSADKLIHRAQLISMLDQQFPQVDAADVDEVINSDTFEYARCPDCREFFVRLAEG
jgi:hypothetical protein